MYVIARLGHNILIGEVVGSSKDFYDVTPKYLVNDTISRMKEDESIQVESKYIIRTTDDVSYFFPTLPESEAQEGSSLPLCKDFSLPSSKESSALALEACRGNLSILGLVRDSTPVLGSSTLIRNPFHAYMRADPFKDIARLHEGTDVVIADYYKGCAVIEADGERFYLPIEDRKLIESKAKDDDYYFNQDYNKDGIPDPLAAIPSKIALARSPSSSKDNYNPVPDLPKVAGNLYALPDIDMDDVSVLKEGIAADFYYCYYQELNPDEHGKSGATTDDLAKIVMKGAPAESMFQGNKDWESYKEAYVYEFKKTYPSLEPDLDYLKRDFLGIC
jgi:hypothetical protein